MLTTHQGSVAGPGVVAYTLNSSVGEAEAEGFLSSRTVGRPGLLRDPVPNQTNNKAGDVSQRRGEGQGSCSQGGS